MLSLSVEIAQAAVTEDLFAHRPLMLSAGGSAFLNLCAAGLPTQIGRLPVERVIRPGCYITHDSGLYRRLTAPAGEPLPGLPRLDHALEVWGVVQSLPEEGVAIVGVGKRDVSYDVEPPIPLWLHRPRSNAAPRAAEGLLVAALWDQHLSLSGDTGRLRIGDLIGFGISHPCGTFDRWTALFTVNADHRVTGAVTTLF